MVLEHLHMRVTSPNPEERRRAVADLSLRRGPDTVPLVLLALGDADWRVRKEAVTTAISRAPDPELTEAMVRALRGESANVSLRNAAVEALAGSGVLAIQALEEAIPALDEEGRKMACEALGRSRHSAARQPLTLMLEDVNPNVRQTAIENLALVGETCVELVAPLLEARLDAASPVERLAALEGLNRLHVILPWERLAPSLRDPILRSAALPAAGRGGDPRVAPLLAEALERPDSGLWRGALHAALEYCRIGTVQREALRDALRVLSPGALDALQAAASGPDVDSRRLTLPIYALAAGPFSVPVAVDALDDDRVASDAEEAILLLGREAVEPLVVAILDEATAQRSWLMSLLTEIVGEEAPPRVSELFVGLLDDPDADVVDAALVGIARCPAQSALLPVARLLASDDQQLRRSAAPAFVTLAARHPEAARELSRTASPGSELAHAAALLIAEADAPVFGTRAGDVAFLRALLSEPSAALRRAALRALGKFDDPASVSILRFALSDEDSGARAAAVRALGDLAERGQREDALGALLEASASDDESVRETAIEALGALGGPVARQRLLELLQSPDPAVAMSAVQACIAAGGDDVAQLLQGALRHPDAGVVRAALVLIGERDREAAARFSVALMDHSRPEIRAVGADVLGRVGRSAEAESLRARLEGEAEALVREAMLRAIADIGAEYVQARRSSRPPPPDRRGP